jgi:hypothetical protein
MEQQQTPGTSPAERRMVNQEDGTCKKSNIGSGKQAVAGRHLSINDQ